jgi:hypothetical protein
MVATVVVDHLLAGREIRLGLTHLHAQRDALRSNRHAASHKTKVQVAAMATGMGHQLAQRWLCFQGRQLRHICTHTGVNIEFALFGQQQYRETGEMLTGRTDTHARPRRIGHAKFDASETEATPVHMLAVMRHAHHQTRRVATVDNVEELVEGRHAGLRCALLADRVGITHENL